MLVAVQLDGVWSCWAPHLISFYTRGLNLLAALKSRIGIRDVNTDADGLANEAIDLYNPRRHIGGVVTNDRWLAGNRFAPLA